ncbi:MAG: M28 family peptidase [marine benthic group bacterium]|nr:M28 family peptidase [Candidatus Benthicola marisminoris]
MRKLLPCAVLAVLATASSACGQVASDESDADRVAGLITEANLRTQLGIIAHDSMRGRDTPSPELTETANYIAGQFEEFGLEPGAGDGYIQSYPMTRIRPAAADRQVLEISGPASSDDLQYGTDFFVQATGAVAEADGLLVLVQGASDMPSAANQIAVLRVTTANIRQVFGGRLRDAIQQAGPAGLLVVLDLPEARFEQFRGFLGSERVVFGELESDGVPVAFAAQSSLPSELSEQVEAGSLEDGWTARLSVRAEVEIEEAPNTIAVLRGLDPDLRDEYVLLTAHMDHVGVGRAVEGDSIYNGADDDGSGTVTVVEIARAFASLETAPRRSIIFMTVSGEEKGLLGSRYYAENPTFPLENTVANINLDMVGRNWSDTIVAIGKAESTLGPQVERISAEHPELDMAVIDDIWPEESFYTRSDHYNFATRGVPILFFFNGTHDQYHQPADEVELIDYDKMARLARLVFYLSLEVANDEERPAWDPEAYERVVRTPRT